MNSNTEFIATLKPLVHLRMLQSCRAYGTPIIHTAEPRALLHAHSRVYRTPVGRLRMHRAHSRVYRTPVGRLRMHRAHSRAYGCIYYCLCMRYSVVQRKMCVWSLCGSKVSETTRVIKTHSCWVFSNRKQFGVTRPLPTSSLNTPLPGHMLPG